MALVPFAFLAQASDTGPASTVLVASSGGVEARVQEATASTVPADARTRSALQVAIDEAAVAATSTTTTTEPPPPPTTAAPPTTAKPRPKPTTTTTARPKPVTTTTAKAAVVAAAAPTTAKPAPPTTAAPPPPPANRQQGGASFHEYPSATTCAHRTLPMGTSLTVTNLANGRSTTCRVGDRGPFVSGRIIDLSRQGFAAIASVSAGVIDVAIEW